MNNTTSGYRIIYSIALSLLFPFIATAQQRPAYDASKGFIDYEIKMNSYYKLKGIKYDGYKQWKRLEWYFSTRLDNNGKLVNIQRMKQDALQKAFAMKIPTDNNLEQPNAVSGSWSQVGPTSVNSSNEGIGRVNRLGFHPTDVNTLYAATAGGGLWKTTNGGNSWQPLTDGLPNLNISDVSIHPTNPNIIYILTGDADGGGDIGSGFGKYSTGVLKSLDGGITWNYTGLKWNETDEKLGYKLIMHPSNFSVLMVASTDGIYYTENSGSSWELVLPGERVYDIEFMPNNGLVVYAGASGGKFFKSTNGGVDWTKKYDNPNPLASRVGIAVTPDNSSEVFMLIANNKDDALLDSSYTFNGIYYSSNMGESGSWQKRSSHLPDVFSGDGTSLIGRQQNYDHSFAVNPFENNRLITGGISMFRSTNGGTTLTYVDNDLTNYHVDIHELAYGPTGSTLYAATDGGVYKSTNDGASWTSLNNNIPITQYYRISVSQASTIPLLGGAKDNGSHLRTSSSSVFDLATGGDGIDNGISVSHPSYMYTSKQNGTFWRSTNGGSNFSDVCSEAILEDQGISVQGPFLTNIEISPTNPNLIFLGYTSVIKGVYNGVGWSFFNIGANFTETVSGRTILEVAPSDVNTIYAGDFSYGSGGAKRLWKTTNGGTSWSSITVPYTLQRFSRLTINPDDPDEIWLTYGGFDDGFKVFRSLNGGTSWSNITGSLPNIPVNCIVYADNNGNPNDALYVGTDIGVFYRDNTLGDWIPFSTGLPVAEVTDLEINAADGLIRAGTYGRGAWQSSLYSSTCNVALSFSTNSHPPSKPGFFPVSGTISSVAVISGAGATIKYKAGEHITLNPGFRIDANSGAKLLSYIGPCPGPGVPPVYLAPTINKLSGYLVENK